MSLGAHDPHDLVEINGSPPIRAVIEGGIQGDAATAAIIANCLPAIAIIAAVAASPWIRSEEHTSELQSRPHLVCRLLLEKKKKQSAKRRVTASAARARLATRRRLP